MGAPHYQYSDSCTRATTRRSLPPNLGGRGGLRASPTAAASLLRTQHHRHVRTSRQRTSGASATSQPTNRIRPHLALHRSQGSGGHLHHSLRRPAARSRRWGVRRRRILRRRTHRRQGWGGHPRRKLRIRPGLRSLRSREARQREGCVLGRARRSSFVGRVRAGQQRHGAVGGVHRRRESRGASPPWPL